MTDFTFRLRELRRKRNLSQEELAKQLGISRQAVIALEQGVSLPSLPVVMAMIRVLDVPFTDLFNPNWSPFRILSAPNDLPLEHQLSLHQASSSRRTIPVDLYENENTISITAELTGVKEQDVIVDMSSQHVLITAIKRPVAPSENTIPHCREITYGPMLRIISLPCPIDTEATTAEFGRGLLILTLPKQLPRTKRRITFKEPKNHPLEQTMTIKEQHGSE